MRYVVLDIIRNTVHAPELANILPGAVLDDATADVALLKRAGAVLYADPCASLAHSPSVLETRKEVLRARGQLVESARQVWPEPQARPLPGDTFPGSGGRWVIVDGYWLRTPHSTPPVLADYALPFDILDDSAIDIAAVTAAGTARLCRLRDEEQWIGGPRMPDLHGQHDDPASALALRVEFPLVDKREGNRGPVSSFSASVVYMGGWNGTPPALQMTQSMFVAISANRTRVISELGF